MLTNFGGHPDRGVASKLFRGL